MRLVIGSLVNSIFKTYWAWGCYSCDVRGDITAAGNILQICRNLQNRKTAVSIRKSTKLKPYHMAYLKLPFLQNRNPQNWNVTTWSCHFHKTGNQQNWSNTADQLQVERTTWWKLNSTTTWHLWICWFCKNWKWAKLELGRTWHL